MAKGSKTWAITGGNIPLKSTGIEPENTSRDVLYLLNTTDSTANVGITVYYPDREPSALYEVTVDARRMRNIRFNDLIDPEPVPLVTDFAAVLESDVQLIVGFAKIDTSSGAVITTNMMAQPL
jgi:hypothetical protein